jgi:galactokinase
VADVAELARYRRALAEIGLPEADLDGRASLVADTIGGFREQVGEEPAWVVWVPGRIEIFGKHTDYAGGRSLVAAVPRGFVIAGLPRADARVTAFDARWRQGTAVDLTRDDPPPQGWANYVAVVARRLASNFPGAELGTDIVFASDLPRAAGVSSSSALVVGVAGSLIRRAGLQQRPEWQAAIHDRLDLGGYLGAVENGLTFGSLAGTSGVGTHGGSEDHTAILNGQPERVSAFSYVPVRPQGTAAMPAEWRFVIMPSGVEAAKAGGARGRYNAASLSTRALVDVWHRDHGAAAGHTLAAILAGGPDAERALRQSLRTGAGEFTAEALDRRLSHFVGEDARVPQALEAFARADAPALGALSASSQADAERLLGNQIPPTSALAALARETGAFAASSFGAGFGGSVWALVGEADRDTFPVRWRTAYERQYPSLPRGEAFLVRPGPAATELELTD